MRISALQQRDFLTPQTITWGILALLGILYGPLLWHWYNGWLTHTISLEHEYFSHGVVGLPLAAYLAWERRDRWTRLPDTSQPIGAVFLGLGSAFYLSSLADTVHLSFPLILIGLCLWLKGWQGLRLQAFPLILVALATPTDLPYLIAPYTLPLQKFIASVAAFLLLQLNIDVTVREIYLFVGGRIVEVAPHCAGLKALFTNLYFCLIGIYWTGAWRSRNKSITLMVGAVLVSVVVNILRNTALTIFHGTGQDSAFHWLHDSWGQEVYWVLIVLLLVGMFKAVDKFWPVLAAIGHPNHDSSHFDRSELDTLELDTSELDASQQALEAENFHYQNLQGDLNENDSSISSNIDSNISSNAATLPLKDALRKEED